jgi:gliding motility-associated-like protein
MRNFMRLFLFVSLLLTSATVAYTQEICDDGIDNDGDGLIDCYDPDCYSSDACGFYDADYCRSILPDSKEFGMQLDNNFLAGNYQVQGVGASYNYRPYGYAIPKVADIDNDEFMEIVVVSSNGGDDGIFIFDPLNDQLKYFIPLTLANNHTGVTLADVDADPYVEIFIATGLESTGSNEIYRYDFDGTNWNQYTNGSWPISNAYTRRGFQPDIIDFNEDGTPELLFYGEQSGNKTAKIFNISDGSVIIDLLAKDVANHISNHIYWKDHYAFADVIPAGFDPGTGPLLYADGVEFITGTRVYTIDIATGNIEDVWGGNPTGVHLPWVNGANSDGDAGQKVALGDINVDGNLDIVVTGQGFISVWDPLTNASIYDTHILGSAAASRKGGIACIGDVDGDANNQPEIGVVSNSYVEVFRANDATGQLEQVWGLTNSDNSGETACNFFDFEGDGSVEMVYRDETDLWVYEGEGDGAGGEKVLLTSNPAYNTAQGWITNVDRCSSNTGSEHPIIVDVDQNNRADIVVACVEGLRVYRDRLTPWISSRGVFNQRSYSYVNVNNDMTVPAIMQKNHIVPNLNNYLTQMYRIDKAGNPFYPAPDFTVEVKSAYDPCHGAASDRVNFVLNIFNYGDGHADLFELPITFYNGDPAQPGAKILKQEIVTVDLMPLNAKETHVFDVLMSDLGGNGSQLDGEIYITINDGVDSVNVVDGNGLTTIATTLPNSPYPECDYSNNTIGPFLFSDCQLMVPLIDLDADDNNTGAYYTTDYVANYPEGGGRVNISDTDVSITDNGTQIASAIIEIYNPLDGTSHEGLFWDNAVLTSYGITTTASQGDTKIFLTGVASIADYENAIELFQYQNTSDFPNPDDRLVVVRVVDADDGLESGSAVCHFTLSGVNDAPTSTDNTVTTVENTDYIFDGSEFSFSDPDGDSFRKVQITTLPTPGTLYVDANTNGTYNAGEEVTALDDVTINQLYAGVLRYSPLTNESGVIGSDYVYTNFTFAVSDGTAYAAAPSTITIRVLPDNFLPTATDNTVSINEDTDHVFAASEFNFSDLDAGDDLTKVQLVSVPSNGTLYLDASNFGVVDAGEELSTYDELLRADIDASNVKFKPATDENGTPYTYFYFKVHDGVQYSTDYYTFTFNVTALPDDPVITANSVTVDEGFTGTVLQATATDGDVGDTRTFSISGTDATDFNIDADTGEITFVSTPDFESPDDDNGDNVYAIRVTVTDGTSRTDFEDITITVVNIVDALSIQFTADNYASPETTGGNIPQISISGEVLPYPITIEASVTGGTATIVDDYTNNITLLVANGDYTTTQTQPINLNILNEALVEANETITFELVNPTPGVSVGARSTTTYTITNDDTPGFTVTVSEGSTTTNESGTTDDITVELDAAPVTPVEIDVLIGDVTEGSVLPASLTFNSSNWNVAQLVTVTGVDDFLNDGNQSYNLTLRVDDANSDDFFDPLADQLVSVSNVDNDNPGITISAISNNLNESGVNATFTIVLNSQPTDNVTIPLLSSDTSEGTLAVTQAVFAPDNWSDVQTITVTAVDELLVDGDQSFTIVPGTSSSTDFDYNNISLPPILVINEDDDTAPVIENGLTTLAEDAVLNTLVYDVNEGTDDVDADGDALTYSILTGNIDAVFSIDETTGEITVTNTSNLNYETRQQYILRIQVTDGANPDVADITINITNTDSDVELSVGDVSVIEGDAGTTNLSFVIESTVNVAASLTVNYDITDNTATDGSDYNALTGVATLTPGSRQVQVVVAIEGDHLDELDETFTITLSAPSGGTLVDDAAIGTILDDDESPVIANDNASIAEDVVNNTNVYNVNDTGSGVDLDGDNEAISYSIVSGNDLGIFDVNASTGQIFVVDNTNLDYEVNTQHILRIRAEDPYGNNDEADITVQVVNTDSDIQLSINDPAAVLEGDAGTVNLVFTVSTNHLTANNYSFDFASSDVTATAGDDYQAMSGSGSVTAGTSSTTITVLVNGDNLVEANETFNVTLSNILTGLMADATGVGTITDDDAVPDIANATVSISEDASNNDVVYNVDDVNSTDNDNDGDGISYSITNGNSDGVFTIHPTTGVISVLSNANLDYETVNQYLLTVQATDGTNATTGLITVNVTNTDSDVSLSINDVSLSEGNSGTTAMSFTVTSNVAVANDLTFDYATAEVEAVVPNDFTPAAGTLTFSTGETYKTITISIVGDKLDENNETFTITLSNASAGMISDNLAVGTIIDDDNSPVIDNASATVQEDAAVTTEVFDYNNNGTNNDTDADGDQNTYSITAGNDDGIFGIDPLTGIITVVNTTNLDFETTPQYILTIEVTDGANSDVATITIDVINTDADAAITVGDATVAEGDAGTVDMNFNVTSSVSVANTLTFDYLISDVSTSGMDYTISSGSGSITAVSDNTTLVIPVVGDVIVEGTETFTLTISNLSAGTLADATATGTITDDDNASISLLDASASESDGTLAFIATLDNPVEGGVVMNYSFSDVSATGIDDYNNTAGSVTFIGSAGETQTINVSLVDDPVVEDTEIFTVSLTNVNPQVSVTPNVSGTITDNDGFAVLNIENITLDENGSNNFTVTVDKAVQGGFQVSYSFFDGTAIGGNDFDNTAGILNFMGTAGETHTITVTGIDDAVVEGSEQFTVQLNSSNTLVNTDDTATGTIIDDDATNVTIKDVLVTEGQTATFTLTLNKAIAGGTNITCSFTDVTAAGNVDYNNESKTITFVGTAGETHTLDVAIPDDAVVESTETFTVHLSSSNTLVGADDTAIGTIEDNDGMATIAIEDQSIEEGGDMTFTVTLDKAVQDGCTVNYTLVDGTATGGVDFNNSAGSVGFAGTAGEIQQITVTTIEDQRDEGSESFTMNLSTTHLLVDASDIATGQIMDNDVAGITVSTISNNTSEAGQTATFTVVLRSQPKDDVTIDLSSDDTTEGTIAISQLTFTPSDWNVAQTIVVTGVDDADVDGDMAYTIVTSQATSTDANYNNMDVADVAVVNDDNDVLNTAPVAVDDAASVNEDELLNGANLLANDIDPEGNAITINTTPISGPNHGILTINGDGTYTYTPLANYHGEDTFVYEVCDDGTPQECATATVTITVAPVNDQPIANDDVASVDEDVVLTGGSLLENDSDPDGDNLVINTTPVSGPANGTVIINTDGTYEYTPNSHFFGEDSFVYEVCDDGTPQECVSAIVTITVNSVNDAPLAIDDAGNFTEGGTATGNLLVNDSDPDGDKLTITTTPVAEPTNGTVVINPDGTYVYTPLGDFAGKDSFQYEVCDNGTPQECSIATVHVSGNAVNDAPVAIDDVAEIDEDNVLNGTTVLGNDSDPENDELTVSTTPVTDVQNGTLVLNADGTYIYTPDNNFFGEDSFVYEVCDNGAPQECSQATVTITVKSVNDAPVAQDDAGETNKNEVLNGASLLGNDTDPDGDKLTINTTPVAAPVNGALVIHSDGTYTYTPDAGFTGEDNFSYEVCDDGTPQECSIAQVTITVVETDTDGDGIPDVVEGDDDLDGDGLPNDEDLDSDDDGILDSDEGDIDTDGDGDSDYKDLDSDNDGILDSDEGDVDTDGDGESDFRDLDSDNDGILDADESTGDCDNDQIPDRIDPDECYDEFEVTKGFSPNGDGINDYYEIPWLDQFTKVSIEIFNRWGNVVFKEDIYQNNWDGNSNVGFSIGKELPVGTYYYILIIHDTGEKKSGYIYLNR